MDPPGENVRNTFSSYPSICVFATVTATPSIIQIWKVEGHDIRYGLPKKSCCSFGFCPNYLVIQTYDIQLCGLSSDGSSIFSNHLPTQLLPGRILLSKSLTKRPKVKTRVVRRTLDPVYDEDFTFYGIHFNQLPVSFKILEHVQLCWPTALPRV